LMFAAVVMTLPEVTGQFVLQVRAKLPTDGSKYTPLLHPVHVPRYPHTSISLILSCSVLLYLQRCVYARQWILTIEIFYSRKHKGTQSAHWVVNKCRRQSNANFKTTQSVWIKVVGDFDGRNDPNLLQVKDCIRLHFQWCLNKCRGYTIIDFVCFTRRRAAAQGSLDGTIHSRTTSR